MPLAIAETGCFTYKDSPFFCSDIQREQAINECQLYGCNVEQTFILKEVVPNQKYLKNANFQQL